MSVSEFGRKSLGELLSTTEGNRRFKTRLLYNLRVSGWNDNGRLRDAGGELPKSSNEEVMLHFLDLVRNDLEATHVLAVVLDREQQTFESLWSGGFGSDEEARNWAREQWSWMKEALSERNLVSNIVDLRTGSHPAEPEYRGRPGKLVAAPVIAGDRCVGLLVVGGDPEKQYTSGQQRVLRSAAFVLGQTIYGISGENESREILYAMIQSLAAALDARDAYTRGHSDRVAMFAMAIANERGEQADSDAPGGFRDQLRLAALLHDIGKIGIRDDILLKPEALTDQEYGIIKKHPELGADIIKSSGALDYIVPGVLYHHERRDGSGYPVGLEGEEIPLVARIIGLADAFDAMTSDRTFRPGMSQAEAIEILKGFSGTHFDPELVDALIRAYEKGVSTTIRVAVGGGWDPARDEASTIEEAFPGLGERIPSLPAVVSRLNDIVRDPDCSAGDIANVLSTDEGMVARVLKIANSAFYALPGRIGSIPLAVTILGITTLRSLVISTALADITRAISGCPEVAERLWDHGMDVGVWSRWISRKVGGLDPEEAFTAGLLHDIGKGLALRSIPADREKVRMRLLGTGDSSAIEKETLGFDHTELGGWAADRWRLPSALVRAVRWHHRPEGAAGEEPEIERLVWVVHMANILAWGEVCGPVALAELLAEKADPVVLRCLPFGDPASIEEVMPFVQDGIDLGRQLFSKPVGARAANPSPRF